MCGPMIGGTMSAMDPRQRYAGTAPTRRPSRLDRIPGYRGYHEKEARRDADGALRRALADDYTAQAQRLTRVQQTFVAARRLDQLSPVDTVTKHLTHFIDRLRTATYGYAGLRDNQQIGEQALDQLYHFDLSLADGVDAVTANIDAVEQAAESGDPKVPLGALDATVRDLMARFDARADVLQTGQPTANVALFDVMRATPRPNANPVPALHLNDAVSVDGRDWIVAGRTVVSGVAPWTDYLLRDGETERWLTITESAPQGITLAERVEFWTRIPPVSPLQYGGVSYRLVSEVQGTGMVSGGGGERAGNVHAWMFTGENGETLSLRDWGMERQAFVGNSLLSDEVQVYPQQPTK